MIMRKKHTIPTILGLFVLIVGIAAGVFLIQTQQSFRLSANPTEVPQSVRVTNVTDNSFTVSWFTPKKTRGYLGFGKNESLGSTVNGATEGLASLHYSEVKGLLPGTDYFFKIGSGENLFDDNGDLYKVKTAPGLSGSRKNESVFGKITPVRTVAGRVIVFITAPGISPLSTLVDQNGDWVLNISSARSTSLSSYAAYTSETIVEILGTSERNQTTSAKIKVQAARPVPAMFLGKSYNFTDSKALESGGLPESFLNLASVTGSGTPTPTPTGKPTPTPTPKGTGGTAITTPTPTPTPTPTKKPTPTPTGKPTPTPTHSTSSGQAPKVATATAAALPSAGGLTPTIGAFIMGLSLLALGTLIPALFVRNA
ncbi:MAG: hypothetical protein A2700_00650 [Candidatus Blackburnbacteria bacterium RIFCSPHIGHO2_01_FULL_44_64]|uniref:Fibronectin type-III domain-containing protein n=1 Tax=Candidatus Blackburnbacteria bacterium RIFCSPHIGHO2_02_FULL_44_20 TaxID=1797516 RepID=A0A1G1V619_9BACT|nr:MAG: hypothetical protein A2700_00650 [Candidatus Blackburnbacteria bacterium RIFCSPHIGHO2_01_FULL_44_64]OGY10813.1 MAG: hypothetical protein A3D26_01495 [Candidatus Blackburnbacteria bacterium RIFCSPHIGHO2_02_FULL_44_20]OGY15151.1 MAG: hypothetical protein A3A62_03175 [Candidatus Blackburnbacteria bacterium RIFCSPLOWO2_01_FULL_44_43]